MTRPAGRAWWAAGVAAGLVLALLFVLAWPERDDDGPTSAAVASTPQAAARGAYLAVLGNCAGCHTARGGRPYAGGRALHTPFGTVYAGNLTPDDRTGLGRWSADDFWRALHHGRSRDGRLLLPAFPYAEFTRIRRDDSDALWAFLRTLPPVVQPNRAHDLRFPYDGAIALAVWRRLFFRPGAMADDPARSSSWNRGAYLVRGLGHCASCHAPRNVLGATADAMTGAPMPDGLWFAPALPDAFDPVDEAAARRHWVALLKTGRSTQGSASGPMAELVFRSTQHWTDDDLDAVATYLASLPRPPTSNGRPPVAPPETAERGRALYAKRCADCHGVRGEGVPSVYPPLAGNPSVRQADARNLLRLLDHGSYAPATAANPRPYSMPAQALSDADAAAVLSHIRQAWGNGAGALSEVNVLKMR